MGMLALNGSPGVKLHPHLEEATFVTRLNRFAAIMRRDGREIAVHVANSGRLEELVRRGHRAAVVFVIQRGDAVAFSTNRSADPLFSDSLANATQHGVEAYAYRCQVSRAAIQISDAVPVQL